MGRRIGTIAVTAGLSGALLVFQGGCRATTQVSGAKSLSAEIAPGRPIPDEGPLPPDHPVQGMGGATHPPLSPEVAATLDVLYKRPSPRGPPAVPRTPPLAINVVGGGAVIRALPGPPVFAEQIPPALRIAMPKEVPQSNNVVRLPRGQARLTAFDRTTNDTKLSSDSMAFEASFSDEQGNEWKILELAVAPLSLRPVTEPWLGGVAIDTVYNGSSGRGDPAAPLVRCAVCGFGYADVWKNGRKVGSSVLLEVMLTSATRDEAHGYRYLGYDTRSQPVRELHVFVRPEANLPTPGGFLYVMWESSAFEVAPPEEIAAKPAAREPDFPTLHLDAVPYLRWSESELHVAIGQRIRILLSNDDPSSFHGFTIDTPEGRVRLWLPQGSSGATSLIFDQAGRYEFFCPVDGHRRRGMHGQVIVDAEAPPHGAGSPTPKGEQR